MHPRKSKKGKQRREHSRTGAVAGPSATTLRYGGPIWTTRIGENADMTVQPLIGFFNLASNAGGIINPVYDQTMTTANAWTHLAASYDEFRVLGFQVEYFPNNRYTKVTTLCTPLVGVVDRDSNGALPSFAAGFQYASARMFSLEDPWTDAKEYKGSSVPSMKWKMDSVEDAVFLTTAAPTPTIKASIKFYGQNLTASTTYGIIIQRFIVEFRGRNG